jgi:hypothetical protein
MNYIICSILICYNIIGSLLISKKSKNKIIEVITNNNKNIFIKEYKKTNIILLFMNLVFIVLKVIYDTYFIPDIIIFVLLLATFMFYNLNNKIKINKEYRLLSKNDNTLYSMIINLIVNIVFIEEIISIKDLYSLGYLNFIGIIFIIFNIAKISSFFRKYKSIMTFKASQKDYLEDIKTSLLVEKNIILKYSAIGIAIIFLLYVKLPYAYIVYILFVVLALLILKSIIDKIRSDLKSFNKDLYNMNFSPSKLDIANIKRRILIVNTSIIIIIIVATLSIISYLVGEIEFIIFAINVYFVIMYLLLKYKCDFIYVVYALEKDNIDKNKYSVNINDKITEIIDYKKSFLNFNLYKIAYIDKDNNIYISDIELYNIKDKHEDVEIYINPARKCDYVVVEEDYY